MSEIAYSRVKELGKLRLLPLLPDRTVYRAAYRTADAVFQPIAEPREIRIAKIIRQERGDFKRFMDKFVWDVDCRRIRFVGVQTPDDPERLHEAWDRVTPPDARPLFEAVHGFEFERIGGYTTVDGDSSPVDTLVGTWEPPGWGE